MNMQTQLPIISFKNRDELRAWLLQNYSISKGILVQIFKKHSVIESVTFEDVLKEGLCFGWSESKRLKGDENSYLQQFTPRRTKGTNSSRNIRLIQELIEDKSMTEAGLAVILNK